MSDLISILSSKLESDEMSVRRQLEDFVSFARERASHPDGMVIQDLGTLRLIDGTVKFEAERGFTSAVNFKYRPLVPISVIDGKLSRVPVTAPEQGDGSAHMPEPNRSVAAEPETTPAQPAAPPLSTEQPPVVPHELSPPEPSPAESSPAEPSPEEKTKTEPETHAAEAEVESAVETEASAMEAPTDRPARKEKDELPGSPSVVPAAKDSDVEPASDSRKIAGRSLAAVAFVAALMLVVMFVLRPFGNGEEEGSPLTLTEEDDTMPPSQVPPAEPIDDASSGTDTETLDIGTAEEQTPEPSPVDPAPIAGETDPQGTDEADAGVIQSMPASGAVYSIIIGSTQTQAQADVHRRNAPETDYPVDIFSYERDGQTGYRVGIGYFSSVADAVVAQEALGSTIPDGAWVIRVQ